jgi:glycosyltransferase involved in cell wall biosynthesis
MVARFPSPTVKPHDAGDKPGSPDAHMDITDSQQEEKPRIVVREPELASFVVLFHNQHKYVREAIEGAFSQTYSPLEIILSDDCSTDGSFETMEQLSRAYRGPHKLLLNRNTKNLGICNHVNFVFGLTKGQVFITAGGDDVSLPDRSAALMAAFDCNPSWYSVVSGVSLCGEMSGIQRPFYRQRRLSLFELCLEPPPPRGCAAAYRRKVFANFPPLSGDCQAEDMPLSFRAGLIGIAGSIPDILVKYRVSSSSLSFSTTYHLGAQRRLRVAESGWIQILRDFDSVFKSPRAYQAFCRWLLAGHLAAARMRMRRGDPAERLKHRLLDTAFRASSKIVRLLHPIDWLHRIASVRAFRRHDN